MIKLLLSRRIGNLVGFFVCAGMLAVGYYLELVVGLEPPLCIVQRCSSLQSASRSSRCGPPPPGRLGADVYGGAIALIAAVGVAVAGRQCVAPAYPADQRRLAARARSSALGLRPDRGAAPRPAGVGRVRRSGLDAALLSIPEWTLAAFLVFAAWAVFLALRD